MRKVKINEATASKRRFYFYLVDATDGLTAETGEAGGQPQISTDGAAWTNTGIGTLTAIGNGGYYAEVTQAAVNTTAGTRIDGRYKSANTAEAPALEAIEVVDYDDADLVDATAAAVGGIVGVPTAYAPTAATRAVGSNQGGAYTDLAAHDETSFSTGEDAGSGMSVQVDRSTSTTTERPSVLRVSGYYNGSSGHSVAIQVYDYTLSAYVQRGVMLSRTTAFDYLLPLTSDNQNPSTGAISVRFLHSTATYNASHRLYLDFVSFEKVGATALNLESDIAAIKMRTDQLQFTGGKVYAVDGDGAALATSATALSTADWTTGRAAKLDLITSSLATSDEVAAIAAAAAGALAAADTVAGATISFAKGEDVTITLSVTGIDLTTSKVYFSLARAYEDTALIAKANTAGGGGDAQILVTSATTAAIYILASDSSGLEAGDYKYDVWAEDVNLKKRQLVRPGKAVITERVKPV